MTPAEIDALLDLLPLPACVMAGDRIIAVNTRMTQLGGFSREEFLGAEAPFHKFTAPAQLAQSMARREARRRGEPVPDEFDFLGLSADGGQIPARVRVSAFPPAGPEAYLFTITDDRVRERAADLIRGFVDVAVAAQQERTQADFFRVVRDRLSVLGLRFSVLELQKDRFRMAPFLGPRSPAGVEFRERLGGWAPLAQLPLDVTATEGTLLDEFPAFVARITGQPPEAYVGRVGDRGVVTTIRVAGEPRYVIACSGDHLDGTVAGAFGLLGRQLSAALETTHKLEELDRRNAELSLLLELGQEVVSALDVSQVLQAGVRTAQKSLRCSCAYVFLPAANGTALRIAAREETEPATETRVGTELPIEQPSLSGIAFESRQVQVSADNQSDPRVAPEIARRFGCKATLAVPLLSRRRALGVLTLMERSERVFDPLDVRLATHAAQLIASAMENARLYAEQRSRAEEMALLNDVAQRLAGSIELQPLLELGGETLRRLLGADLWFMLLPAEDGTGLRFHASSPGYRDLFGNVLRFDEPSLSVTAYKERRLVQHTDLQKAVAISPQMARRFGNRIVLAAPLIARDQCLGVAVLLWDRREQTFSQPELGRALAVAGQLALALLSAQLYQDLRRSYAELERTQKELIDRERLAVLGGLSASIAHEVRNPLGVIFNSVGSLRRLLKPSGDVALLLDIVGEEADRLNRMVGDLLDYSRPVRPSVEPLPLRPLLDEALTSARQQIGAPAEAVKVDIRLSAEAATVRADARLLRQALINVFLNAYQAMPRGGQLDVRAVRRLQDGGAIAEIAIRDSGAGIPAEARDKIFQPFFTTKAMGTGLGLAVVKRIVEGHGGTIALAEAAAGAEFQLRLPIEG